MADSQERGWRGDCYEGSATTEPTGNGAGTRRRRKTDATVTPSKAALVEPDDWRARNEDPHKNSSPSHTTQERHDEQI